MRLNFVVFGAALFLTGLSACGPQKAEKTAPATAPTAKPGVRAEAPSDDVIDNLEKAEAYFGVGNADYFSDDVMVDQLFEGLSVTIPAHPTQLKDGNWLWTGFSARYPGNKAALLLSRSQEIVAVALSKAVDEPGDGERKPVIHVISKETVTPAILADFDAWAMAETQKHPVVDPPWVVTEPASTPEENRAWNARIEAEYSKTYETCIAPFARQVSDEADACNRAELKLQDKRLNQVYQSIMGSSLDTAAKAKVRETERAWLKTLDPNCSKAGGGINPSEDPFFKGLCLLTHTIEQRLWLDDQLKGATAAAAPAKRPV